MAQYHIKAEKLKNDFDTVLINNATTRNSKKDMFDHKMITPQLVLECMTGCSQLRQRKVIETFFKEIFPNVETEMVQKEHEGRKYEVLRVKN